MVDDILRPGPHPSDNLFYLISLACEINIKPYYRGMVTLNGAQPWSKGGRDHLLMSYKKHVLYGGAI
jgi:hypothetical protein